ncbi:hypothetical protein C1752_03963 [Acaryochloris thomasi RCC1774]|uniref:DUF1400 domain-containing protein n=1 Tax=Acaryochloris thomasi RCC1774 TaxID=1764569 RepID=A0A2W1JE36_9CYAN|nr:alpha/beta hydrolase [Acaryochloris thomasi]PZD72080.1 hypothetical protein C1752_03963 [Acaryochloris thomasi RCC1774]
MKPKFFSWLIVGLASAVSIPLLANKTQAAENIRVSYKGEEVTVSQSEINTFSETGTIPTALQDLLNTDEALPTTFRNILTRDIQIPTFVENFLQSKNGEFLFLQLDKAISSSSGRTEADLEALKSAVLDSIDDRQVSFLEIIDRHPMDTIRVDLTNLESTYNDVSGFVEKVLPALEVAKGVLQDIVCDCDPAQEASNTSTVQPVKDGAHSYRDATTHANCNKATTLTKAVPLPDETVLTDETALTEETFQSLLKSLDPQPVDQ